MKASKARFEMYDVLEIDWRKGDGWQQFVCLKDAGEWGEAARIVRGGVCHAMPHWIARADVSFRIVTDRGEAKLTE